MLIVGLGMFSCDVSPDNLKIELNFMTGLEQSKDLNKPIFLHFTGFGCVGYNEFYNDIVTSRNIQEKLNEEFITIELYVDDKREIQVSDTLNLYKIKLSNEGRNIVKNSKTIGDLYSSIQVDWLKSNSQPTYLIIDSSQNILVKPFGYTNRNREYFLMKLEEGIRKLKTKN